MHYRQLTFAERRCIAEIVESEPEISARCIARRLGRSPSTICAEIHRNSRPDGTYLATYAQETTIARRHSPRGAYKKDNPDILEAIVVGLQKRWSPTLISMRLKQMYPHDRSRQMSHETMYALIREDRAYGGTWYKGLPQAGRKRRKRYGSKEKRGRIKNRVGIEMRPKVVDSRSRIGDWEGDTVEGCKGSGGLSTFVERKTQLLAMSLLQGGSAKEMNHATRRGFNRHPGVPLKTVTVDNGREFAEHEALSKSLGLDVYFARPYHAWERGLNEQVNGMIRWWFPKGTDFRNVTHAQVRKVEKLLNERPREKLGYRTPAEVMHEEIVRLEN